MTARVFLFFFALVFASACAAPQKSMPIEREVSGQVVILKLDDFRADGPPHKGWVQVMDFLNAHNVTASIGLIGEGLEDENPQAIEWLLAQNERGHEIWNHGYCHCRETVDGVEIREFRGTALKEQQRSLYLTQKLAQTKLGLTLTSFGAPFNSSDDQTARAIALEDDISVWIFKDTDDEAAPTDLTVLPRINAVNIEYPVHVPDFDQFRSGYEVHKGAPVLILQGHPQSWADDPKRFLEFRRIVHYLQRDGAVFKTPSEFKASSEAL